MLPLQIHVEVLPTKVRLTFAGEIDALTLEDFTAALQYATDHGGDVELHMAEVTFMDSQGLGALVKAWSDMPGDLALSIVEPSPTVTRLIGVTSLSLMFGMSSVPVS